MSKKKHHQSGSSGIVYSTDPGFVLPDDSLTETETIEPALQSLKIRLDTRNRAGKAVSLVTGFIGKQDDLEELGKKIKAYCGTGGSVKDGEIIVQGDHRDKILQYCLKLGYARTKKA